MKQSLLLLFYICPAFSIAQNWTPFTLTDKYNYILDNDAVVTQTVWPQNYSVNGADTILRLNGIFCDSCITFVGGPLACDTCYGSKNAPGFFGRAVVKDSTGWVDFRIPQSRVIDLFASPGDTWLFDTIANVNSQVIGYDTATVLGVMDSVKTLLLSTGDTVRYSREHGILQWPNGYGSNSYYRLVGIHGRNVGVLVPRSLDYFDFQVGDMFEYLSYGQSCFSTSTELEALRKYVITSVNMNGDTFTYHAAGHVRTDWFNWTTFQGGTWYDSLDYDMVYIDSAGQLGNCFNHTPVESEYRTMAWWCMQGNMYQGQFFSATPGYSDSYEGSRLFIDANGVESIAIGTTDDPTYYELRYGNYVQGIPVDTASDTLARFMNGILSTNVVVLKKGLGQTAGYYTCHFECFYVEHLEAYRKGNDTIGNLTPDSYFTVGIRSDAQLDNKVRIFPVPASDLINVEFKDLHPIVTLCDLEGRTVRDLGEQIGSVQIDVSGIDNGVYIVRIVSVNGTSSRKVIISH